MAVLKARARNALASSQFAGPNRSYPVPDRTHAANAKARATQQEERGALTAGQANAIRAKADQVLRG